MIASVRKILFDKHNVIKTSSYAGIVLGYMADFVAMVIRKPLPISSIRIRSSWEQLSLHPL